MSRALIIIPTYNEKDNIDSLLGGVFQSAPDVSVLFVDDNSQDGTADKVREWMAKNSNVNILEREGKLGLGSAYVAGFKWGLEKGFDQMIEMDADLSHKPIYLPSMLKTLESKDVSVGSRYTEGGGTENWGFIRRFISRSGSLYARVILGLR